MSDTEPNNKKSTNVVFVLDIDGTLADNSHRLEYLQWSCLACGTKTRTSESPCPFCGGFDRQPLQESFDSFMDPDLLIHDSVAHGAYEAVRSLREAGIQLVFLTGRSEDCRDATELWLQDKGLWDPMTDPLYMRSAEYEGVPASNYKEAQAARLKKDHPNSVFFFAEDDPHVFPVYQKYGIVLKAPEC